MAPERLIGIINQGSRHANIAIGKIELMRNFCFIEADSRFSDTVLHAFSHLMINGKKVSIEIAGGRQKEFPGRRPNDWKSGPNRSNRSAAGGRRRR